MTAHRTYSSTDSPFLPLTNGRFEFALPMAGTVEAPKVQVCRLFPVSLGHLVVPSGHLVVSDPFHAMQRVGNHVVLVPPGSHEALVTIADISNPSGAADEREAYLSLVVDSTGLARRQAWQAHQIEQQLDPAVPKRALRFMHLTEDGTPPANLAEFGAQEFIGVTVNAVTVAMVDAKSLEKGMPEETPGHDWYATLFSVGVPGSWFELMDNARHLRPNVANVVLPRMVPTPMGPANLVLSQSGWGNDVYPVIGEYAFDTGDGSFDPERDADRLVAVHVNFFIVPCAESPVENEPITASVKTGV